MNNKWSKIIIAITVISSFLNLLLYIVGDDTSHLILSVLWLIAVKLELISMDVKNKNKENN